MAVISLNLLGGCGEGGAGDAVAAYVEARGDRLKALARARLAGAPRMLQAAEAVRGFVAERRRILYGGQAIDYALRLRGGGLYSGQQLPDYDFFSDDSVGDAYDLADRLHAAGFGEVRVIGAVHAQTMRVGVEFDFVADVSYVPPAAYAQIATLEYEGMRIVHPDYQRMDVHLSFSFPLENPPRENVFHRFAKDLARFGLLAEAYPIHAGAPVVVPPGPAGGALASDVPAFINAGSARGAEGAKSDAPASDAPAGDVPAGDVPASGAPASDTPAGEAPPMVLAWAESSVYCVAGDATELATAPYAFHGFAAYGLLLAALDGLLAGAAAAGGAGLDAAGLAARRAALPPGAVAFHAHGGRVYLELGATAPAGAAPPPRLELATDRAPEVVRRLRALQGADALPPRGSGTPSTRGASAPLSGVRRVAVSRGTAASLQIQTRRPYGDLRPTAYEFSLDAADAGGGVAVYDVLNRLLAVGRLQAPGLEDVAVRLVSPHYLLLYFLFEANVTLPAPAGGAPPPSTEAAADARRRGLAYYAATLDLLDLADEVMAAMDDGSPEYGRLFAASPFHLPVETLGRHNRSEAYIVNHAAAARTIAAAAPIVAEPEPEYPRPRLYTPARQERPPPFNYASNPAFERDGALEA